MLPVTELVFVMSRRQNCFFIELAEALRDELTGLGVQSDLAFDGFPEARRGSVNVLMPPHEYFAVSAGAGPPDPALLRRSVFICAEQPGSQWFEYDVGLAQHAGAVLDINAWAAREWVVRHGVKAEHLPVGWTRRWDRSPFGEERDIDIAFLGSHSDRRAGHLAGYAPSLWRWHSHLLLSDNGRPNPDAGPDFVIGDEKRDLLARSRVLLNLHSTDQPYLEGLRLVEAIHCGAVVVSEHSAYTAPFVAGRDYLSARPENLMLVAQELLEDEDRRRRFAEDALQRLREELPLRSSAERLASVAS
jgi:glycosyltransferase involved in cell wall biosynthesis